MPKKQQNPPLPSPLSSAPHPWGHPTHGCIPEAPKSWPAFAISHLGGPCFNPCPLSPSPCSSPGVTSIAAAPLPVPLHELAGQPLQGLWTDPLSPLLPRWAPQHPATHPGGESGSPGAGCPPCGCPRGGRLGAEGSPCRERRQRLAPRQHQGVRGVKESPPGGGFQEQGARTRKGTSVRDAGCEGRVEEPQQSQAQSDLSPAGGTRGRSPRGAAPTGESTESTEQASGQESSGAAAGGRQEAQHSGGTRPPGAPWVLLGERRGGQGGRGVREVTGSEGSGRSEGSGQGVPGAVALPPP